ncbi:MAG: VWA domain-containing protein [Xanthobacteraceae bacterium]
MSKDRSGRTPAPSDDLIHSRAPDRASAASSRAELDAFLTRVSTLGPAANTGGRGRLVFALDATMSRQPTWDQACVLQADMFREAAAIGGLDIQLVYYRGLAECRASPWVAEPQRLGELMSRIDCRGGHTQIAKVLAHARRENDSAKIGALVFVGDAMEEALDYLCAGAGELGLRNVPAFMFQEGYDPVCEQAFREIARLTRGAYCRFAPGAAHELAELLRAAAAYAAGGMKALADLQARHSTGAVRLIEQLK